MKRQHDETLGSICKLVETESPSGDVEGSRAVVTLLVEIARTIPAISAIERIPATGYGEHLRVRAFNGHLVQRWCLGTPIRSTRAALCPRRLCGRKQGDYMVLGVFDMKASCVLALEALRTPATLGFISKRPVVLLLTCDEETGSQTGRQLVEEEARSAAQALVLEPPAPGGQVKTARKGVGMWKVKAQGIASHAGLNPAAGASAILEIARQTERFNR